MMFALWVAALAASLPAEKQIAASGPMAPLAGTLVDAGKGAPVVLVIPGSGPTDRDGNSPLGIKAAPYRLLAHRLSEHGISTVRADKRGLFGSKAAVADANKVSIADYVADTRNWIDSIRKETGAKCVWLLGHSEGGLIALTAAQQPAGVCGVITVAAVGRRFGDVIRQQLKANPANAPLLPPALAALESLEQGKRVDSATLPAPLQPLFANDTQSYLIELLAEKPDSLAARLTVPLLVAQGDRDIQVTVDDAKALAAAQPAARLAILPGVNHVLKVPEGDDRVANLAAYANPDLPVAQALVDAIVEFVRP